MHCIINKCAVGDMYTRPWNGGRARSGRGRERERYIGQQVRLIGGCGPTASYLLVMAFRFIVGGERTGAGVVPGL